jgi:hypothetical protein
VLSEARNKSYRGKLGQRFRRHLRRLDIVDILALGEQTNGFHHLWNIHPIWTSDQALGAGGANPWSIAENNLLPQTQPAHMDELSRSDIHMCAHWADGGAGPALNAFENVDAADLSQFCGK